MTSPYQTPLEFLDGRFDAAAVHCSDGRMGAAIGDLLSTHLGLVNCDRVVVPGGPGALVDHRSASLDSSAVLDDLQFLIEAHELDRVVLVQHARCAFYGTQVGVEADREGSLQRADLTRAAFAVRQRAPKVQIDAYRLEIDGTTISFAPVDVG